MLTGNTPKVEKVLVDLDALLDTRLATLAKINEDLAIGVLNKGYRTRTIDSFPGVSAEEFKKAYAKRDVDTLVMAVATNAFVLLQSCIKGSIENIVVGGPGQPISFEINYHPYDLESDEIEMIKHAIESRTMDIVDVTMVKIDNMFLTPTYCKENYALMIRYDYVEWIEMHQEELAKKPMPAVGLIAPALYHLKVPSDEEMADFKRNNIEPFQSTEIALAPAIGLRLIKADVFSLDSDIKPRGNKSSGPNVKDQSAETPIDDTKVL